MKKIFINTAILACLTLLFSCYKEKLIVPTSTEGSEKFTFPQGSNDYDLAIKKVYDDFGVKIIYKDFKPLSFEASWTAAPIGIRGYDIPLNQQRDAVNYVVNNIFANLTPQITKKVLPPYFYVADSVARAYTLGTTAEYLTDSEYKYYYNGLDFWSFCWDGAKVYTKILSTGVITYPTMAKRPSNSFAIFYKRGVMLKEIMTKAVNNGNIKAPDNFSTGFDFTTAISTATGNANFYMTRGFPGRWSNRLNFNRSVVSTTTQNQNFIDYMHMCMRWTPDSIAKEYPVAQYPLIHQKYPIVIKHMKDNYGVDLTKIATKP